MSDMMLALGDYRFSVGTAAWEQLSRTDNWRWASLERLERKPAMQYVGEGSVTVELSGRIYPHYKGGLGQLTAMRAEAAKGKPLLLNDGLGNVWGKFCILKVSEDQSLPFSKGVPRRIEFRISLESYGDDEDDK